MNGGAAAGVAGSKLDRSFQPARHLSQNKVATGCFPETAIVYRALATLELASAAPRSSSLRKYFRKVLGDRTLIILAISSCRIPKAARDLTRRRCSSLGSSLGRGILDQHPHRVDRQRFARRLRSPQRVLETDPSASASAGWRVPRSLVRYRFHSRCVRWIPPQSALSPTLEMGRRRCLPEWCCSESAGASVPRASECRGRWLPHVGSHRKD